MLLFVTKTICLPAWIVNNEVLDLRSESGEGDIPLLRSSSRVSTVPSKRWSPDHRTPILLTSSAAAHPLHDAACFKDVVQEKPVVSHTVAVE